MSDPIQILATYLHLAQASELRQRRFVRDRLLVLAATVAAIARLPRIAACCRHKILAHNPRHILGQQPSVEESLRDEKFLDVLRRIQARYSVEKAERMLVELGLDCSNERNAYYSDEEYAASLLGVSLPDPDDSTNEAQS